MRKKLFVVLTALVLTLLVACGGNGQNSDESSSNDEVLMLEVNFIVPETVDVGETVELKAEVTYGDDMETDAEVNFEVWETGDQENSDMLEAENHGDGTYTAEYTFEHDGIFEMYAHTDAQNLHTMPKKEITVGEGGEYDTEAGDGHGFHTEGFDMLFMEPEDVRVGEETELMVHLMMHDDALENANVRYEIWPDGDEDSTAWVDTEEGNAGEYTAHHAFEEAGTYHIQIHVEDDEDLHEHMTYEVDVH